MTILQEPEQLFELVNDSVMIRTMEGRIDSWNRSAMELYGWSKEEAIGKISHYLLQTKFPKPLEEIESELFRNGQWEGKLVHTTRDGADVVVESRWTLGLARDSRAIIEINAPSTDRNINPKAFTHTYTVDYERPGLLPVGKSAKVDDLLVKFADGVLGGGASLCVLVWFYFIYSYGWAGETRFSTPFALVLYGLFPVVLAGLLFTFLRRSPEFKVNAAIVCVSAAVSVYAVELSLAVSASAVFQRSVTFWGRAPAEHQEEIVVLAKKSRINFDLRTKYEVVRDLRERGISAVPAAVPVEMLARQPDGSFRSKLALGGTEVLPLSGISNRVTVLCNETGKYAIYNSDQRGFHNPKRVWESKSPFIAALGDSFTNGACVPSNKNFVALIRERYPDTVNLGMLGEGPLIMLAALKEYLAFLKPNIVLWFFYEENDFVDLLKESKTPLLINYLKDGFTQALFDRQEDIDRALETYIEEVFNDALVKPKPQKDAFEFKTTLKYFLKLAHLRQRLGLVPGTRQQAEAFPEGEQGQYSDGQFNLFRDVLLEAKRSVHGWGGTLYFVYLPARDRYANNRDFHRESILAIVKNIDIPIVDVHESFRSRSDPLSLFPFGRFGHYNEDGNRVVAESVLRGISP